MALKQNLEVREMDRKTENKESAKKLSSSIIAHLESEELKKLYILMDDCITPFECTIKKIEHIRQVEIKCTKEHKQYFEDLVNKAKSEAQNNRNHVSE